MRVLAVFLLTALSSCAADFATAQAARLVIGQTTFTAQDSGASDVLLGAVSGLAYANDTLFVADSNRVGANPYNHRVLIFRNLSQQFPQPTDVLPLGVRCNVCVGRADTVIGQPDFTTVDLNLSRTGLRLPTAVASDGKYLAIADTDNNRILIWNNIPVANGMPADVVVGQDDFTKNASPRPPTNKSLRGPQGVWIQDGRLYVADTQNHRVLMWNKLPTSNGAAADLVLGQPDFTTAIEPDLTKAVVNAQPNTLLNPVSVTSDGQRLYVADLGHNRVLIWNSIPTQNQAPADVEVGQPDFTSAVANNSAVSNSTDSSGNKIYTGVMCASNGTDTNGNATFPARCAPTLSFPRFALSDGQRLFIADGGNDRVLVYQNVPTTNGQPADIILGQIDETSDQVSDSANPGGVSSSDSIRTPMSLAWDGTNLYVSDPFDRRVIAFTMGDTVLPYTAVRNAASLATYAVATVTLGGTITSDDQVTIKIGKNSSDTSPKAYTYKIVSGDTFDTIVDALIALINAADGDPNVIATPNKALSQIVLTARTPGDPANSVTLTTSLSTNATITATASGATLAGGGDAAKIAPGTLVTLLGDDMSDDTDSVPDSAQTLPTQLAGVQVYFDGVPAPLRFVSPGKITAQVPWEVQDATSISAYVRTVRNDGRVTVTTSTAVPIIGQNPGIFAEEGPDPRPGIVMHGSNYATGVVSVDGSTAAGDVATVTIEDRNYSYVVQTNDTLAIIRDSLINLINQDPKVQASRAGLFTRIRLQARVPGPEGDGMPYSAKSVDSSGGSSPAVIMTPLTPAFCCANAAYSRVTEANPALPGETIIVYATGLGLITQPDDSTSTIGAVTGAQYSGPYYNTAASSVSSLAGAKTANVLQAGLKAGTIGIYEVHLQLNSDLPTNPVTQLTIAQDVYVSNIITFPLLNPTPPASN